MPSKYDLPYRLIRLVNGCWSREEFAAGTVIGEMRSRGFCHAGANENPRHREELQGQPVFTGLLGPMWDGDGIRYECPAAYDALST